MKGISIFLFFTLLITSTIAYCPYTGNNHLTTGILISGNASHEVINGKIVPKEEVVRDDGLYWKCEMIVRDNTEVKDCRLYERIYFEWDNTTDCSAWCNETIEPTIEELYPTRIYVLQILLSLFKK